MLLILLLYLHANLLSAHGNRSAQLPMLSEKKHGEVLRQAFQKNDMIFRATTHVLRKGGARVAESLGVTELQISRLGKWANGAMENVYLGNYYLQYSNCVYSTFLTSL